MDLEEILVHSMLYFHAFGNLILGLAYIHYLDLPFYLSLIATIFFSWTGFILTFLGSSGSTVMAEVDIAPRFGAELKDGFKPVNAWVTNGVTWLDDIQQFYRERAAIEKEYSSKLYGLAKKNFEKKAKRSSSLSVGDTPSMTPGSLEW